MSSNLNCYVETKTDTLVTNIVPVHSSIFKIKKANNIQGEKRKKSHTKNMGRASSTYSMLSCAVVWLFRIPVVRECSFANVTRLGRIL